MTEKQKISMNMDELTFGELEVFEDVTGMVMSDAIKTDFVRDSKGNKVADPDDPKGRPLMETKMGVRAMMGMVFISMRRDNPDVTWGEIQAMKLSDVEMDLRENADDDAGKVSETETQPES